jgi:protocatechuate 3,4-dioxygenase beta subunit
MQEEKFHLFLFSQAGTRGRAPHVHVEVLTASGTSLLVTQIAFPENVSSEVYSSTNYVAHGQADTSNTKTMFFQIV